MRQRLLGLTLGYGDLNDLADPRRDPLLAVAVRRTDPLGAQRVSDPGRALAAPATLQPMETGIDHNASRYHRLTEPALLCAKLLR